MSSCAPATSTYVLQEPYGDALKSVRAALQSEGLRVPLEMDISSTLRQELGVEFKPCKLLCVYCPWLLLQASVTDIAVGAFLPLHLVVADHGSRTLVHFINPASISQAGLPLGIKSSLSRLLTRVLEILGKIGTPQPDYPLTA